MILLGDGISKKYMRKRKTSNFFYALEPTSLELRSGVTMVSGRSGSGKSTLLNILSGILVPSEGKVLVDGTDLYSLSEEKLAKFRCENMGIIPQGRALIDSLTVMENIMLPGAFYGSSEQKKDAQIKRAKELMEQLQILDLCDCMPGELSGGEQRRASIVRGILHEPKVIMADEPTGDLDSENTKIVLQMLSREADRGAVVLLVTHEKEAAVFADVQYDMESGRLK